MIALTRARQVGLAILAGAALAVVPALTASAHIAVTSPDAEGGHTGTLTFRVPVESDTANTTAVSIEIPTDTPFASVTVEAVPGWTSTIETTTLDAPATIGNFTVSEVPSKVTWTADGAGLAPGEYANFTMRVGPFPEAGGTFAFPATQTYSDGTVVEWADPVVEGQEEPEHPTPTLTVAPGTTPTDDHDEEAAHPVDEVATSGGTDTTARVLGIVGVVVGALGLGAALVLGRRSKATGS